MTAENRATQQTLESPRDLPLSVRKGLQRLDFNNQGGARDSACQVSAAMSGGLDCQQLVGTILEENDILFEKISTTLQCDPDLVPRALVEVLRFMDLVSISEKVLTPSQRVDLAWHEFILCTRAYQRLCNENFGRMIHHRPGGSAETNRAQFQDTLRLYRDHFGTLDPYFWGPPCLNLDDVACGSCQST